MKGFKTTQKALFLQRPGLSDCKLRFTNWTTLSLPLLMDQSDPPSQGLPKEEQKKQTRGRAEKTESKLGRELIAEPELLGQTRRKKINSNHYRIFIASLFFY